MSDRPHFKRMDEDKTMKKFSKINCERRKKDEIFMETREY